jgi:DNA repair protein RadC
MMCKNIKYSNLSSLSDAELLAKLIGIEQAQEIYQGSLSAIFNAALPEQCVVARELVRRWLEEELQRGNMLNAPAIVRDYLRLHFADYQHEAFVAIFLDAQHHVLVADELFRGTLTQTSVYPREVVKAALKVNAAAVIFAHNHPSGVAEPSQSDQTLTVALKQALALVDVRVLDHFIVAGTSVLSFAEKGML